MRRRRCLAAAYPVVAVALSVATVGTTSASASGVGYRQLVVNGHDHGCVAVATTERAQQQGLRGAPASTPPMAFVFSQPGRYGFWMAGVTEPITVAWVAANRLVGAVAMAPESATVYTPPVPIRLAIEFIAGRGMPPVGSDVRLGSTCRR